MPLPRLKDPLCELVPYACSQLPVITVHPFPGVFPSPSSALGRTPRPFARPIGATQPAGGVGPQLRPRAQTSPLALAHPALAPGLLPRLGLRPGLLPGQALTPDMTPLEATQPGTAPNANDCQNTGQQQKQKKKQKKKSRNVCYRGTYEERRSGLLKFRKEQITCR